MSPDDPGVMGNLPRSRPGRRSSKRGASTAREGAAEPTATGPSASASTSSSKSAAGRPTAKKTTAQRPAAKRTTASGGKAAAAARTRTRATETPSRSPSAEQPARGSTDPVTGAVMLAGKVVEGGLKVAGGIVKRLPRP